MWARKHVHTLHACILCASCIYMPVHIWCGHHVYVDIIIICISWIYIYVYIYIYVHIYILQYAWLTLTNSSHELRRVTGHAASHALLCKSRCITSAPYTHKCVAVRWIVLQYIAVCCSLSQCVDYVVACCTVPRDASPALFCSHDKWSSVAAYIWGGASQLSYEMPEVDSVSGGFHTCTKTRQQNNKHET